MRPIIEILSAIVLGFVTGSLLVLKCWAVEPEAALLRSLWHLLNS